MFIVLLCLKEVVELRGGDNMHDFAVEKAFMEKTKKSFIKDEIISNISNFYAVLGVKEFNIIKRQKNDTKMKVDVLCVGKKEDGKKVIMVIEIENYIHPPTINKFQEKLRTFKDFFEEYKEDNIIGIMTNLSYWSSVKSHSDYFLCESETETVKLCRIFNKKGGRKNENI